MKVGNLNIFRGRKLSLSLVVLICLTLVIWAWENTPLLASFLPSTERFTMPSPEMLMGTPVSQSLYTHQKPSVEKDSLDVITHGVPGIDDSNEVFAAMLMGSSIPSSPGNITGKKDLIQMPSGNRDCNFAKGKWILDNKRPLYSGFGCKQWLSKMWACRLMQRTDFYYERVRWQPYHCEMPDFDGSKFLRKMQHKTIAFVGDSLGRQQFQSLMCMATGGKDSPEVENVGREYGLVKARGAIRPDGWAYRFPSTNTTILYYWSAGLCELEPLNRSDSTTRYAMHLDRPATFLSQYLHMFDVLVLNTGHHWNRGKLTGNRWDMYVGGVPNIDKKLADVNNAKNLTVYSIVKWVDSQLPKHPHLRAFFRTISPRHFVNGDWNTGGSCDSTIALARGSEVLQDGSTDTVVEGAVKATRVKILDITAISQLRDEGHISKYGNKDNDGIHDCLHWCLPGIPDTWNEILFAQLYEDVRS